MSRRGTLRFDEEAFADYAAKRARWQSAAEHVDTRSTDGGGESRPARDSASRSVAGHADCPAFKGEARVAHGPSTSSPAEDAPTRKEGSRLVSGPVTSSPAPYYPLVGLCRAAGLPEPVPEYQFHPKRKWRADYAFLLTSPRVIVEVEGGAWTQGRHTRGKGFLADMEKYNAATLLGFVILRYTPDQLAQCIADLRTLWA